MPAEGLSIGADSIARFAGLAAPAIYVLRLNWLVKTRNQVQAAHTEEFNTQMRVFIAPHKEFNAQMQLRLAQLRAFNEGRTMPVDAISATDDLQKEINGPNHAEHEAHGASDGGGRVDTG